MPSFFYCLLLEGLVRHNSKIDHMNTKIVTTVVAENTQDNYLTNIRAANHSVIADEPKDLGGMDTAPSPVDYLCMSLASCKTITLRMYVQRKKWNIENIKVKVSLERAEEGGNVSHTFHAEISVDETVSAEQRERLVHIAKACPISKLLSKQNYVQTILAT